MNHAPPKGRDSRVRQVHRFLNWFEDHNTSRFDLAVARRCAQGQQRCFLSPLSTGHQNLHVARIIQLLSWLRAENANRADIYLRPHRHAHWPMVFLDDVPVPWAEKIASKYASAVVETSSSSCHVWITTRVPLDERQRFQAQKFLIQRLAGLADPASASGDHWGRMPGFKNHKPNRHSCWVNLRRVTAGLRWTPILTHEPSGRPLQLPPNQSQIKTLDFSRNEWGWVMGSLENHIPPAVVLQRLIQAATPRRGSHDARRYANQTLRKACRLLGIPIA